eukprot:15338595-Ditylum_brightwellii.AAC.1
MGRYVCSNISRETYTMRLTAFGVAEDILSCICVAKSSAIDMHSQNSGNSGIIKSRCRVKPVKTAN